MTNSGKHRFSYVSCNNVPDRVRECILDHTTTAIRIGLKTVLPLPWVINTHPVIGIGKSIFDIVLKRSALKEQIK